MSNNEYPEQIPVRVTTKMYRQIKAIAQREARRLRKQVESYQRQEWERRNAWCQDWPMGTNIGSAKFTADSSLVGAIRTSRLLRHAVVVSCNDSGLVNFHAMPLVKEKA